MNEPTQGRPRPEFDEAGFLTDPESWSPELARELARRHGLPGLDDVQCRVLEALRAEYLALNDLPGTTHACRVNGLDHHCLNALFGDRPLMAWRLAGLPDPGEEAKAYL